MNWSRIARRVRVPLGFLLAVFYLWIARPALWSIFAGSAIAVLGLAIRALASGTIRKNEELAMSGLYAYTRNPLYLGSILLSAGFAVAARSWIVVVVLAVMFFVIYLPVIRGEEQFLRERFPEFTEYERRVPRLIPPPIPRTGPTLIGKQPSGSFSRALYMQHREYNALLGTIAMLAALTVKLFWFSR